MDKGKLFKIASVSVLSAVYLLAGVSVVIAVESPGEGVGPSSLSDFVTVAEYIAKVVYWIAISVAIILIIWSGIKWMLAGGNDEKVTEARKMFVWGLVGFAVVLFAYAAQKFIEGFWAETT